MFPVSNWGGKLSSPIVVQVDQLWWSSNNVVQYFIDFQSWILVRSTQFIGFSASFWHLQSIQNSLSQIMNKDRLSLSSTIISNNIVMVEEFSLNEPTLNEIIIHSINSAWSNNSGVWENIKNLLFSNILCSQINWRTIRGSSSSWKMNQSLYFWVSSTSLSNSSCNINIDIFSLLKSFNFSSRSNEINNNIRVFNSSIKELFIFELETFNELRSSGSST